MFSCAGPKERFEARRCQDFSFQRSNLAARVALLCGRAAGSLISGRLSCVSSFANAIAICRGRATLRERFFEYISATLIL